MKSSERIENEKDFDLDTWRLSLFDHWKRRRDLSMRVPGKSSKRISKEKEGGAINDRWIVERC